MKEQAAQETGNSSKQGGGACGSGSGDDRASETLRTSVLGVGSGSEGGGNDIAGYMWNGLGQGGKMAACAERFRRTKDQRGDGGTEGS